jgi:hypothetical protein
LSDQSQTNGPTSRIGTSAKQNSATSRPRETRVAGISNTLAASNKNEFSATDLKLSGRQLREFSAASESVNKVHINSNSQLSRANEPNKTSLTADHRMTSNEQSCHNVDTILLSQSNVHAQRSDYEDAGSSGVNGKNSGYLDNRCPMTGLVATRCSKTQSPKISLIAAVSNKAKQDFRNGQNWKTSPRHDEIATDTLSKRFELRRGSRGGGRRSSSVFREAVHGSVNGQNRRGRSVGNGVDVVAPVTAQPASMNPVRSSPISSYKPASHHEPCFDV